MNVSIASVVRDLDTSVSGVQSAIALEALVSAAFILIGSKVGDLIGRKRAYVLGLLGRFISTYLSWRVQLALIVAILASVLGLLRSFRMRRLGDPEPSGSADGMVLG